MAPYQLDYTERALDDIAFFKPYIRRQIFDTVDRQLAYEPMGITRNRKPLDDVVLAAWELRIGVYRVFYDIDQTLHSVIIRAVGMKDHNTLYIRGKAYPL